jgi:PadR family transcriptional regulator, regulatory protein PadR
MTPSTLDVLEALLEALDNDAPLDAWAITQRTRRTGAAVMKVIDRLEDAGWITAVWESDVNPGDARRRLYRLKPNAAAPAAAVTRERITKRARRFDLRHPGLAQAGTS